MSSAPAPGWFGPFRAVARIGQGGAGEVWRAEHADLGVPVAVKVVPSASRAAFDREVANLATLAHPGIVPIFDRGLTAAAWEDLPAGTPWLAMALARGTLATRPPRDPRELRRILLGVLEALGHAHGRGVLHLDLKPTNLLRDGDRVWLADFGLSTLAHRPVDAGWGTPGFAPDEQLDGRWRDLGPWTDLFALGATAACLGADEALRGWIDRATRPEPRDRFRSAAEAREALLRLEGQTTGFPPPPPPEPLSRPLAGVGAALFGQRTVPLVGREAERRALWADLREATVDGGPRWRWLEGPSGVGKSRLAEWLVTHAHAATGCAVWRARHTPDGGDGLVDAARDALGAAGLEGGALRRRLAETIGPSPALADLLDGRPLPTPAAARALAAALRAVAPAVLWLDDAQDADPELLAALAEALDGAVLVVATCRTDRLDEPARLRLAALPGERLAVGPLPDVALRRMLGGLLGLDPASAAAVAERAAGNPLVAVQLVAAAIGGGELRPGPSGLALVADALTLPPSLTALWARRIAQVVGEDRDAVELAAVLGPRFEPAWRRGVGDADALVARMLRAQLWGAVDGALRWTHEMAREAVLAEVAAGGRLEALHRRAVGCVDHPGEAGRHRVGAGELAEGAALLVRAVKRHASRGEWLAADRADRALEGALERLGGGGGLALDRGLERARMAHNRKRTREARALLEALRDPIEREGQVRQRDLFHWLDGRVLLAECRPREALACFERAEALPGTHPARRARLLGEQARCLRDAGDGAAALERLRAAVAAAPASEPVVAADLTLTLGVTLHLAGRLDEAERAYHDALAAYGEAYPGPAAELWTNLGTLHRHRGEPAAAQAAYDRARGLLQVTGMATDSLALGQALLWLEEAPDRARATLRALCDRAAGTARAALAHLYLLQLCDDPEDWDRHWGRGRADLPELPADPDLAEVLARAADQARAWGWPERASAAASAAGEVRRKLARPTTGG